MVLVLLQDDEHSGRCIESALAGADGRDTDLHAVAVNVGALFTEAHEHDDGTLGCHCGIPDELAGLQVDWGRLDGLRLLGAPERDGACP
jgi:hypothetical protein